MRVAVASPSQVAARTGSKTFPAPVRGWIEDENLALNRGLACSVMENCFPLQNTVRVRKGTGDNVATVGDAAKALIPYQSGTTEKLFATTASALYDISSFDDDTVPTASWTQLTNGEFNSVQIDTGGGQFLVMANGADPMMYFDGTDWFPITDETISTLDYDGLTVNFTVGRTLTGGTSGATSVILGVVPATATTGTLYLGAITSGPYQNNETITGSSSGGTALANGASASGSTVTITGVDTSDISFLWMYRSRIFMVEKDTMVARYLPVDSIGGVATDINLGGVFQKGGSLMFGGTWSTTAGNDMEDRCVFVSTLGEVAVYESDPDFLGVWGLVGRYDVGNPLTVQTWKAGGDFLIATTEGIVPMSAIVAKDPAILETAAVTYPIKNAWQRVSRSNSNSLPVQLLKWQKEGMGIVGYPHRTGGKAETHVVNLATGAWSKWTGHDVQCMAVYQDQAYFGDSSGLIFRFEGGGSDAGTPYTARGSMLPDPLGEPGAEKTARQARATFRGLRPFEVKLSVATDYATTFPTAPSAVIEDDLPGIWDVGRWDVSKWDDSDLSEVRETKKTRWRSMGRTGYAIAPQWQITCGGARTADAELVSIDVTYTVGATVI